MGCGTSTPAQPPLEESDSTAPEPKPEEDTPATTTETETTEAVNIEKKENKDTDEAKEAVSSEAAASHINGRSLIEDDYKGLTIGEMASKKMIEDTGNRDKIGPNDIPLHFANHFWESSVRVIITDVLNGKGKDGDSA